MKMIIIFLLIAYSTVIMASVDSDDEKYIDLLPEEEKEAFLDKVARRLIDGVKTKDSRYKSSEELSEEELNQHSDYVKKILQEESSNLRRNVEEKKEHSTDDLKVKGIDVAYENVADTEQIDLTLRQGNRRKRNEKSKNGNDYETTPVKTVYDNDNIKASMEKVLKDSTETNNKEHPGADSAGEDIQVRGPKRRQRKIIEISHEIQKTIPVEATKIHDFEPKSVTKNNEPSTRYDSIQKDKLSNNDISTVPDIVIDNNQNFTQPIYESLETEHVSHKTNENEEDIKSVNSTFQHSSDKIVSETITEITIKADNSSPNDTNLTLEETIENSYNNQKYLRFNQNENFEELDSDDIMKNTHDIAQTSDSVTSPSFTEKVLEAETISYVNFTEIEFNNDSESNSMNVSKSIKTFSTESNSTVNINIESETTPTDNYNLITNADSMQTDLYYEVQSLNESQHAYSTSTVDSQYKNPNTNLRNQSDKTEGSINSFNNLKDNNNPVYDNKSTLKSSRIQAINENVVTSDNIKVSITDSTERDETTKSNEIRNSTQNPLNITSDANYQNQNGNLLINKQSNQSIEDIAELIPPTSKNTVPKNILRSFDYEQYILTTTNKYDQSVNDQNKYESYYTKLVPVNNVESSNKVITFDNVKEEAAETVIEDEKYVNESVNLERIIQQLREGLDTHLKTDPRGHDENYNTPARKTVKHYEVYELPEGETPFVQQKPKKKLKNKLESRENKLNRDQPYYVPVYNYSPSNAYYNAHNRLGPNEEDGQENEDFKIVPNKEDTWDVASFVSNSEEQKKRNLRSGPGTLRKFKFSSNKYKNPNSVRKLPQQTYGVPLPFVVKKPKYTEIYFNPDDYLDMDYYFGRTNRNPYSIHRLNKRKRTTTTEPPFPGLDDESHPYTLLKEHDIKDHLSAVRQLLYKNQHFGMKVQNTTPKNNKTPTTNDCDGTPKKSRNFRSGKNQTEFIILFPGTKLRNKLDRHANDISVDYYFGISQNEARTNMLRNEHGMDESKFNSYEVDIKEKGHTEDTLPKSISERNRRYKIAFGLAKKKKEIKQTTQEINSKKATVIKKILMVSDPETVLVNLDKIQQLNLTMRRKQNDAEVKVFVDVLKVMIDEDNKALQQYDWMGTTVDILSALKKISVVTLNKLEGVSIHPADEQLLKYILYLFKSAKTTIENDSTLRNPENQNHKNKRNLLPRNKNRRKKTFLKSKDLISRIWLYLRGELKIMDYVYDLEEFSDFLEDMETTLYDLHNAVKHIAMVTKYNKQAWYQNLKQIFLKNASKKNLVQILVHLYTTRLLGLIEDSASNGLEDNCAKFIKRNPKDVERSKSEFVFLLKLLAEYKRLSEDN